MNTDNPTTIREKALAINLDPTIYGSFAEIGGGQEVARNFFKAGAAGGTIAKSMSAYDMVFSDNIYGSEEGGRYVSESRCLKMLDHEYNLLEERLVQEEYKDRRFFVFANKVFDLFFKISLFVHLIISYCRSSLFNKFDQLSVLVTKSNTSYLDWFPLLRLESMWQSRNMLFKSILDIFIKRFPLWDLQKMWQHQHHMKSLHPQTLAYCLKLLL